MNHNTLSLSMSTVINQTKCPEITNEFLTDMKDSIEKMSKNHQLEVFKILKKSSIKLNENKSGTFVNLSYLPLPIIEEIYAYVSYAKHQEDTIQIMEYEKESLSRLTAK